MQKDFIAINSVIHNSKLIALVASNGFSVYDAAGLDSLQCIEWLFNLVHLRKRKGGVVFVCYGFQRSNEFIFSTLPSGLRDKLFQSFHIRNKIDSLEIERELLDEQFYAAPKDTQDFERSNFERHVINHSLNELRDIQYAGFKIELINGKVLTIRKNGKAVSIYDIVGFFKGDDWNTTSLAWLSCDYVTFYRRLSDGNAWRWATPENRSIALSIIKCALIRKLSERLNDALIENEIHLSRYHGCGSIASYILSRSKAKSDFHNYRHRRQMAPELWKAANQAYYSGRVEQFKIGTLTDVKEYDINSAYANAIRYLPTFLRKPYFKREWTASPFSVWYIDYDFTSISPYFGFLPNRNAGNTVTYPLKGSGYFWQPEIVFLLQHYPQCIDIKYGFATDYEPAPFTEHIERMYDLRKDLQDRKHPLQKVVGLSLSAIYGKFKQEKSHFHNLFYAGFITSFVRMQLLNVTRQNESNIICFQTDAIHSDSYLLAPLSSGLGEYKEKQFAKVTYLDNGVYQCYNERGEVVKSKSRGFKTFNFEKALADIQQRKTYIALAEFFIGHNLYSQNMFQGAQYLETYATDKVISPLDRDNQSMRKYDAEVIDLTQGYIDSRITNAYSGRESSVYTKTVYRGSDVMLDAIRV